MNCGESSSIVRELAASCLLKMAKVDFDGPDRYSLSGGLGVRVT